jgi:hypothetical protein
LGKLGMVLVVEVLDMQVVVCKKFFKKIKTSNRLKSLSKLTVVEGMQVLVGRQHHLQLQLLRLASSLDFVVLLDKFL